MPPSSRIPPQATSFADLWGRRWNLTVSEVLRPAVYEPVVQGTHEGYGGWQREGWAHGVRPAVYELVVQGAHEG